MTHTDWGLKERNKTKPLTWDRHPDAPVPHHSRAAKGAGGIVLEPSASPPEQLTACLGGHLENRTQTLKKPNKKYASPAGLILIAGDYLINKHSLFGAASVFRIAGAELHIY